MKIGVCKVKYLERGKIVSYGILYDNGKFDIISKEDYQSRVESGELSISNIVSMSNGFKVLGDTDLVLVINKPYSKICRNNEMVDTGLLHNKHLNCAVDSENAENKLLAYFDTVCRMISSYYGCEYNPYFIKHNGTRYEWETPEVLTYNFINYKVYVYGIFENTTVNIRGKDITFNGDYILIGLASVHKGAISSTLAHIISKEAVDIHSIDSYSPEYIYMSFIDEVKEYTRLNIKSSQLSNLNTGRFMAITKRVGLAFGLTIDFRKGELGVGRDKVYSYRDTNLKFGSDENESYDMSLVMSTGDNGLGKAYFHLVDNSFVDETQETRGRAVEIVVNDLNALDIAVETYIYYSKELVEHQNFGGTLVIG